MLTVDRLNTPYNMRNEKIHDSHYGMEKCLSRAKESLFWPNISKDVEVNVASCGFRVKSIER